MGFVFIFVVGWDFLLVALLIFSIKLADLFFIEPVIDFPSNRSITCFFVSSLSLTSRCFSSNSVRLSKKSCMKFMPDLILFGDMNFSDLLGEVSGEA